MGNGTNETQLRHNVMARAPRTMGRQQGEASLPASVCIMHSKDILPVIICIGTSCNIDALAVMRLKGGRNPNLRITTHSIVVASCTVTARPRLVTIGPRNLEIA
jgi:hypothetical protein